MLPPLILAIHLSPSSPSIFLRLPISRTLPCSPSSPPPPSLENLSLSHHKTMLLKASSSLSTLSPDVAALCPRAVSGLGSGSLRWQGRRGRRGPSPLVVAMAAAGEARALSGVIFEPFEEVKKELTLVPSNSHQSLARQKYLDECEAAINEQINVEYNVSYVYHAMFAYFDRDNIALRGMAKFFKESSEEEREHAEKLMKYQNKRGGRVKLQSIVMPLTEFDHYEKGDALYAMELALSLEKLVNEKLLNVHIVAEKNHDVQMQDFIESEFLGEQVEAIKKISEYVSQLRRVGKGHGVWHFDQMLLHGEEAV